MNELKKIFDTPFYGSEKRVIAKKDDKYYMIRLFSGDDKPSDDELIQYIESGVEDTIDEKLMTNNRFEYSSIDMTDAIYVTKDQLMIRLETMSQGIIAIQQSNNGYKAVEIKEGI